MGGRRRCCCGEPICLLLADDFERSDSTDLGDDWVEFDGDWEIVSGDLVLVSGDGVVITVPKNEVSSRGKSYAEFDLSGTGPWSFSLGLGKKSDNTGGYTVDFELTGSDCTISASGESRTFNQNTESGNKPYEWRYPTNPENHHWRATACLTDNCLYVALGTYDGDAYGGFYGCVWDLHIGTLSGKNRSASISTSDTTIEFTRFDYYGHRHDFLERDDDQCFDCTCSCDDAEDASWNYVPWKIRIDFYNSDGGSCGCFHGGYMILEALECGSNDPATNFWLATSGSVCGYGMGYQGGSFNYLDCGWSNAGDYVATLNLCEIGPLFSADSMVCNPFSVNWDYDFTDPSTDCSWCGSPYNPDSITFEATEA